MDITGFYRWNFDADDDGLLICKGEHERSNGCTMERVSPHETLQIVNLMRSRLSHIEAVLKTLLENNEKPKRT